MRSAHSVRSAYAVCQAVGYLVSRFPSCTFATFTFAENITEKAEAEIRWRRLKGRLLREIPWLAGVGVWQRQARGAWHFHLVCNSYLPIVFLRPCALDCGFGPFINLRAIRSHAQGVRPGFRSFDASRVARYISRYVSRDFSSGDLPDSDKHVRVVEYFGGCRVCTTSFRWVGGFSRLWREGAEAWFTLYGICPTFRDFAQVFELGWHCLTQVEQSAMALASDPVARWRGMIDEPF